MSIIQQPLFTFLQELSENNNREWFGEQKKRFEREAQQPFLELITKVVEKLAYNEPELEFVPPKKMLFRIYRDTRFSQDKTPYKNHLSAWISPNSSKKDYPSHYIQLSPTESFVGGGAYFFHDRKDLERVRFYIAEHQERFAELIANPTFLNVWDGVKGEKNKRLSDELQEALEKQPLIANKQFYWTKMLTPADAMDENFVDTLAQWFEAAMPLQRFLRKAMYS